MNDKPGGGQPAKVLVGGERLNDLGWGSNDAAPPSLGSSKIALIMFSAQMLLSSSSVDS